MNHIYIVAEKKLFKKKNKQNIQIMMIMKKIGEKKMQKKK